MNTQHVVTAICIILLTVLVVALYQQWRDTLRVRRGEVPTRARMDDGQEVGIVKL